MNFTEKFHINYEKSITIQDLNENDGNYFIVFNNEIYDVESIEIECNEADEADSNKVKLNITCIRKFTINCSMINDAMFIKQRSNIKLYTVKNLITDLLSWETYQNNLIEKYTSDLLRAETELESSVLIDFRYDYPEEFI